MGLYWNQQNNVWSVLCFSVWNQKRIEKCYQTQSHFFNKRVGYYDLKGIGEMPVAQQPLSPPQLSHPLHFINLDRIGFL